MSDQTLGRDYPLDGKAIVSDSLSIIPAVGVGKVIISRSNQVPDNALKPLGDILGVIIPTQPCRMVRHGGGEGVVVCLSPNSWIIICDEVKLSQHMVEINQVIGANKTGTITITEVSDQYQFLEIDREKSSSLLSKGCSLDLHPDVFKDNHAVQTLLAQAEIILWRTQGGGFQILFDVSLSDYLWRWLDGAAAEFI